MIKFKLYSGAAHLGVLQEIHFRARLIFRD